MNWSATIFLIITKLIYFSLYALCSSLLQVKKEEFIFKKGPLFSNFVLVHELNRATPKTQSALLEAMEEEKVTVEGKGFDLEFPFVVMATQNPFGQIGTFPLHEGQRDRFFMSLSLGLPDREVEKKILTMNPVKKSLEGLRPILRKSLLKDPKTALLKSNLLSSSNATTPEPSPLISM